MNAPTTPNSRTSQVTQETVPGTWRHPKLDEVTRRLNDSTFSEKNVMTIITSTATLIITFSYPAFIENFLNSNRFTQSLSPYLYYALITLRLYFVLHVLLAFRPLAGGKDNLSDIPLSPSQRVLFGLDPTSTPATPGSTFITPPRYTRSPTIHSSGRKASSSFAGKGDNSVGTSGSPLSPSISPLRHQAIESNVVRRLSLGSHSDPSIFSSNGSNSSSSRVFGTPTPKPRNGINLNSKWLYEKSKGRQTIDI